MEIQSYMWARWCWVQGSPAFRASRLVEERAAERLARLIGDPCRCAPPLPKTMASAPAKFMAEVEKLQRAKDAASKAHCDERLRLEAKFDKACAHLCPAYVEAQREQNAGATLS